MPNIENWGFRSENEVMKGYLQRAIDMIQNGELDVPKLTDEQIKGIFAGIGWATSDLTAQEAYDYYLKH